MGGRGKEAGGRGKEVGGVKGRGVKRRGGGMMSPLLLAATSYFLFG